MNYPVKIFTQVETGQRVAIVRSRVVAYAENLAGTTITLSNGATTNLSESFDMVHMWVTEYQGS